MDKSLWTRTSPFLEVVLNGQRFFLSDPLWLKLFVLEPGSKFRRVLRPKNIPNPGQL